MLGIWCAEEGHTLRGWYTWRECVHFDLCAKCVLGVMCTVEEFVLVGWFKWREYVLDGCWAE